MANVFKQHSARYIRFLAPGLRRWRKKRGLSLREFARVIGYSPSYVSDVECGHRPASEKFISRFQTIAKVKAVR